MQRFSYIHQGMLIYQWEQTLTSINVYIPTPPIPSSVKTAKFFDVKITSNSVQVGIKGNPPYLQHKLQGIVDTDECLWYLQNRQNHQNSDMKKSPNQEQKQQGKQLILQLQKAQKGVQWGCVFEGHKKLNPLEEEQLKKKLMIERFGQQNPGFDFSNADFNGNVPLARDFMGGVKYG